MTTQGSPFAGPQTSRCTDEFRADAASVLERRLVEACTWGTGHLLVTSGDRQEARDLLERVLRRVEALGSVRARACDGDADAALEGLVDLAGGSADGTRGASGYANRRAALLRLIARARTARRSVFVVVDDGEDATVEQLERLRTSIEVAPDAIEHLRLVLIGSSALSRKLDEPGARALNSRITSRVRIGPSRNSAENATARTQLPFFVAAALSLALLAYGGAQLMRTSDVVVEGHLATRMEVLEGQSLSDTRLGGAEPFLSSSLRIPIAAAWVTGSALYPPAPPPRIATPPAAEEAPSAIDEESAQPTRTPAGGSVSERPPGAASAGAATAASDRHAPEPTSSIAALLERFR